MYENFIEGLFHAKNGDRDRSKEIGKGIFHADSWISRTVDSIKVFQASEKNLSTRIQYHKRESEMENRGRQIQLLMPPKKEKCRRVRWRGEECKGKWRVNRKRRIRIGHSARRLR